MDSTKDSPIPDYKSEKLVLARMDQIANHITQMQKNVAQLQNEKAYLEANLAEMERSKEQINQHTEQINRYKEKINQRTEQIDQNKERYNQCKIGVQRTLNPEGGTVNTDTSVKQALTAQSSDTAYDTNLAGDQSRDGSMANSSFSSNELSQQPFMSLGSRRGSVNVDPSQQSHTGLEVPETAAGDANPNQLMSLDQGNGVIDESSKRDNTSGERLRMSHNADLCGEPSPSSTQESMSFESPELRSQSEGAQYDATHENEATFRSDNKRVRAAHTGEGEELELPQSKKIRGETLKERRQRLFEKTYLVQNGMAEPSILATSKTPAKIKDDVADRLLELEALGIKKSANGMNKRFDRPAGDNQASNKQVRDKQFRCCTECRLNKRRSEIKNLNVACKDCAADNVICVQVDRQATLWACLPEGWNEQTV